MAVKKARQTTVLPKDKNARMTSYTEQDIINGLFKVLDKATAKVATNVIVKESIGDGMSRTTSQKLLKDDLAIAKSTFELLGRHKGMFGNNDKLKLENSGEIIKRIINVNPTKGAK